MAASRQLFIYLFLCVLWRNVGANDEFSARRLWTAPSLLNNNVRPRQFSAPPPPPLRSPPPPPPSPPPPPPRSPPPPPPSPPPPPPRSPPPPPPSPPPPSPPPPSPPPPPPPSSSAVLSDIYVSSGTLVPPFNESVFNYTLSVDSSVSELQVSVVVPEDEEEAGYEVSVNGTWVDSGASGPTFELGDEGETVTIYIYIVAKGYTSSLYTIYVTREESSSSGGGGLKAWEIALIVVACVVVVALLAFAVYWAFRKGWFSKSTSDYQSIT